MSDETFNNRRIYTLLEVGNSIRSVISRNYSKSYLIKAEIIKLNYYPASGHCYPDLVEKTKDKITAQMRSIIWQTDFKRINSRFKEVTGEPLHEGTIILFSATLEYNPLHGLSLLISDIEPEYTLGEIAKAKTETINKLKKENLFFANKQLPIPLLPQKIAIISVETSKGYNDFMITINNNLSGYKFFTMLFPAILQGEKAPQLIIHQLQTILKDLNNFDIVAIIRGGGGDAGLSCYDDYELAKTIASFPIPVITGIGHSTNETVTEMVAYSNKITPTELAYFLIEKFDNFNMKLELCKQSIENHSLKYIQLHKQKLIELSLLLKNNSLNLLLNKKNNLQNQKIKLSILPHQLLKNQKSHLSNIENKIKLLDPVNVLKRGYSITKFNGNIIINSSDIETGMVIETLFTEGIVKSRIIEKFNIYE